MQARDARTDNEGFKRWMDDTIFGLTYGQSATSPKRGRLDREMARMGEFTPFLAIVILLAYAFQRLPMAKTLRAASITSMSKTPELAAPMGACRQLEFTDKSTSSTSFVPIIMSHGLAVCAMLLTRSESE